MPQLPRLPKLTTIAAAVALLVGGVAARADAAEPAPVDMRHRAEQLQEPGFGMFVCWSFSTFSGYEWTWGVVDLSFFNPTGFDPDGWCQAAREAEMGYILLLTKHHDGFCLWDTDTTERKVTNSPLGVDVVAEVKKACDRHGLKLALYFSEGEFSWEQGGKFVQQGGTGYWRDGKNPEMKQAQLRELLTRYGPIEFIWFDHAIGDGGMDHPETARLVKSLQPGCFVGFNHGDPTGADIRLGERAEPKPLDPDDPCLLAEFTYPILEGQGRRGMRGAQWFYSLPENDQIAVSADKIYRDYVEGKKCGNIFSLDVGPNRAGRLRPIDVKTLRQVGRYIRGEAAPKPAPATKPQ